MFKGFVWYGSLLALIKIAWTLGLYTYDSTLLLQGYQQWDWLWASLFLIWAGRDYRAAQGPPLPNHTRDLLLAQTPVMDSFVTGQSLLKVLFPSFALAFLAKFSFIYTLFHYWDTNLLQIAKEKAIQIFIAHRDEQQPEAVFEQQLEAFKQQDFGPVFDFLGLSLFLLGGFLLSFILAQLLKRERPD